MDLESEAVASPVEKSDLPSIAHFGRITAVGKELLHLIMQLQSIHAWFHFFQRERLSGLDRFPQPALLVARAAANHRLVRSPQNTLAAAREYR